MGSITIHSEKDDSVGFLLPNDPTLDRYLGICHICDFQLVIEPVGDEYTIDDLLDVFRANHLKHGTG